VTTADPFDLGGVPGQVAPSPTSDEPLKPSTLWYWIGGLVMLIGVIGGTVFGIVRVVGAIDDVDDWPRVDIPSSDELTLDEGEYDLFLEYPGAAQTTYYDGFVDDPDVELVDDRGDAVFGAVYSDFSTTTYSYGNHEGRSFAVLDVPADGTYTLEVRGEPRPGQQVAVAADDPVVGILVGVFGGMGIAGFAVLVGAILMIVTAVKRSRERKRRNPPRRWAPPTQGWYPPASAYPPPPGAYPPPSGYPAGPGGPGGGYPPPGPYAPPPGSYAPPPGAPPAGWAPPPGGTA
jgi:hypothetical protein